MTTRLFTFAAGDSGPWRVTRMETIAGDALPAAIRLNILPGAMAWTPDDVRWQLRGIVSNERYVARDEKTALAEKQEGLDRPHATRAALIPIRKTAAWWAMTQDERRKVFEEQSHHIEIGMRYLPAVARRLHHCRDLGENEPFDFLTWFEYAAADEAAFDALLAELRASPEWQFVDREIELRLVRDPN